MAKTDRTKTFLTRHRVHILPHKKCGTNAQIQYRLQQVNVSNHDSMVQLSHFPYEAAREKLSELLREYMPHSEAHAS